MNIVTHGLRGLSIYGYIDLNRGLLKSLMDTTGAKRCAYMSAAFYRGFDLGPIYTRVHVTSVDCMRAPDGE